MILVLRLVQLAFAAAVAAAGGGLVLVLLAIPGSLVSRTFSHGGGDLASDLPGLIVATILGAGIAVVPAIGSGWLPAFAAGAALWAAGRYRPWARRRLAWAVAGAAVSLLIYWSWALPGLHGRTLLDSIGLPRGAPAFLFLLAGAAAGRLFLSTLAAAAPFLGLDEDEPGEA